MATLSSASNPQPHYPRFVAHFCRLTAFLDTRALIGMTVLNRSVTRGEC